MSKVIFHDPGSIPPSRNIKADIIKPRVIFMSFILAHPLSRLCILIPLALFILISLLILHVIISGQVLEDEGKELITLGLIEPLIQLLDNLDRKGVWVSLMENYIFHADQESKRGGRKEYTYRV